MKKFKRGASPPQETLSQFPQTLSLYHSHAFYYDVHDQGEDVEEVAEKDVKICVTHVRGQPNEKV